MFSNVSTTGDRPDGADPQEVHRLPDDQEAADVAVHR
jgi:hypothetical protein